MHPDSSYWMNRKVRGNYHPGLGHISIHVFWTSILLFLHHIFLEVSQQPPSHRVISVSCEPSVTQLSDAIMRGEGFETDTLHTEIPLEFCTKQATKKTE